MRQDATRLGRAWRRAHASQGDRRVRIEDGPAYPLARMVEMPEDYPCRHGALAIRFTGLEIGGFEHVRVRTACVADRSGERRFALLWPALELGGRYALEAKPESVIEIDHGGDLMTLPPEARRPGYGGDGQDELPPLDPEQESWLEQARGHREKLGATENGPRLLSLYNEHDETYDEAFRTHPSLGFVWQANGATRAMAADTSAALAGEQNVNEPDKVYGDDEVTYNSNALSQQLAVAVGCVMTDPGYVRGKGAPPGKYAEAAKAALAFGATVAERTGNTKANVVPMNPTDIYGTVESHQGDLAPVSHEDLAALETGPGRGGDEGEARIGALVIDEEDRARLRQLGDAIMRHRAEHAGFDGAPVFEGRCTAILADARAEIAIARGPGGAALARLVSFALPPFSLDIDDQAWTGEVAAVARERLHSMFFIRTMLHGALADALASGARAALAQLADAVTPADPAAAAG
jgi:hypothetical protein